MNNKYVLYIYLNYDDFMELNFNGNINTPSKEDIEEIKDQVFHFVENNFGISEYCLAYEFIKKDQTTFEITGVEK